MSRKREDLAATPELAPARGSEPAQSGPRGSENPIAESWRDVLFQLSLSLPIDLELDPLIARFNEVLATLLPTCAIGACVVGSNGSDRVVVTQLPALTAPSVGHDPTRLFPDFCDERSFDLEDGTFGSTLHLASPEQALSPLQIQIGAQAALLLAAAVRRARLHTRAQESARSIRKLQAQVIQNEKLASLGQIVAGVAHELNNPLTSIIAYSDYLKRKALARVASPDREDDLERLRRIGEAAARILNFSRDLVAYARPATDVPGPVFMPDIVDKALVFCEHEFRDVPIRIVRDFAEGLPPVRGMAGQLTQVLVNLFTNAAHAMSDRGGELRVRMNESQERPLLTIQISDTGTGIDTEDMPQIFEPFFTTKVDGRGTGLGLSIVRGILDAHGGTIQAASTLGEGTVFSLTLPLAVDVPDAPPESGTQAPPNPR